MSFPINPQTAAARLKRISPLRPTLAIVLGSGFHHALTELRGKARCTAAWAGLKLCHEHGSRNRNGHPKTEAAGDP